MSIHSSRSNVDVVIGMQDGDEGKGRFVDELAAGYDWVGRYNGGANAGHTISWQGKTLKLHQLPSGVQHEKTKLFIGAHCVINPEKLMGEIREVESHDLKVSNRLRISPYASVIQPSHIILDKITMRDIGTTKNGIGPAYAATRLRKEGHRDLDIRAAHLEEDFEWAMSAARANLIHERERWNDEIREEMRKGNMTADEVSVEKLMNDFIRYSKEIARFVEADPEMLIREWRKGKRILLEGAQAFGLDVTSGPTPNVTSSNTGVHAAFASTYLPLESSGRRIGVAKAIPSRVGHGPFPTEFGGSQSEEYCENKRHTEAWEREQYGDRIEAMLASDDPFEMGIALRILGGEYGATTNRPRRLGALDLVRLRHAVSANDLNEVFLTKFDMLSDFARTATGQVPVTNSYLRNGRKIQYAPTTSAGLYAAEPELHYLDGPTTNLSTIRSKDQLPSEVHRLIGDIEQRINAKISKIGVGPSREQMVNLKD
jgi:adenylosuccinate synthase